MFVGPHQNCSVDLGQVVCMKFVLVRFFLFRKLYSKGPPRIQRSGQLIMAKQITSWYISMNITQLTRNITSENCLPSQRNEDMGCDPNFPHLPPVLIIETAKTCDFGYMVFEILHELPHQPKSARFGVDRSIGSPFTK